MYFWKKVYVKSGTAPAQLLLLGLTEPVPEAFELLRPADWPDKYFSGQSSGRN